MSDFKKKGARRPQRGGPQRGGPQRGGPQRGGPQRGGPQQGWPKKSGAVQGRPPRGGLKKDGASRGGRQHKTGAEPRWIYGRHVVEEMLNFQKACRVLSLWLLDTDKGKREELERRAHKLGAKVSWVPKKELDRITEGGAHQGMALKIQDKTGAGFADFLSGLTPERLAGTLIVALDQIQDPHNFGAIARSAVCLGASAILYTERRSAPLTQTVLSVSAGAVTRIGTYPIVNLAQTLEKLKEKGFWIYGAESGGRSVWEVEMNRPMVLVIGSEGKGIRPLVRSYCDELIAIPQSKDGVDSLNASCAASVLLYEAARQAGK